MGCIGLHSTDMCPQNHEFVSYVKHDPHSNTKILGGVITLTLVKEEIINKIDKTTIMVDPVTILGITKVIITRDCHLLDNNKITRPCLAYPQ